MIRTIVPVWPSEAVTPSESRRAGRAFCGFTMQLQVRTSSVRLDQLADVFSIGVDDPDPAGALRIE